MTLYYSEGRMDDWEENGWGSQNKGKIGEPRVVINLEGLAELNELLRWEQMLGQWAAKMTYNFLCTPIGNTQDEIDDYELAQQILEGDQKKFANKWKVKKR